MPPSPVATIPLLNQAHSLRLAASLLFDTPALFSNGRPVHASDPRPPTASQRRTANSTTRRDMMYLASNWRCIDVPQFDRAALLVIDVQKAIDAAYHAAEGPRNNPDAEKNIGRLLAVWRRENKPIIHVRHDSTLPASAYRPGQDGNRFKTEVEPAAGETIIPKRTNSAFIGTELERHLREAGLVTLVVTGVSTNNSVEATVRMAGNLGFDTYLVADACFTFARRDFHGRLRNAEEVHSMSLANLQDEYCSVVDTAAVLADG